MTDALSVAIIGGGTMGGDVALVFAAAGWRTHIVELSDAVRTALSDRLRRGLATMERPPGFYDYVRLHAALEDVPWDEVRLVVENVPEKLELKQQVFERIEQLARREIPLTSNSSSFPISLIGGRLKDPARIAGLHFFMPAHLVPLVEIIRCEATASGLPEGLAQIVRALGKVPVQVRRDIPGFLVNRLQHALMREALWLLENDIASAEDLDACVRYGYGFRFLAAGPLLQKDLGGLDIHYNAALTIYPTLCNDTVPSKELSERVQGGNLGIKTKQGFYAWTDETIATEKARYEAVLRESLKLLNENGSTESEAR